MEHNGDPRPGMGREARVLEDPVRNFNARQGPVASIVGP
jgi:hypothetical protein